MGTHTEEPAVQVSRPLTAAITSSKRGAVLWPNATCSLQSHEFARRRVARLPDVTILDIQSFMIAVLPWAIVLTVTIGQLT